MDVICKIKCDGYRVAKDWKDRMVRTVDFSFVADSSEENKKFWEATPQGKIEIGFAFEEALKQIDIGEEYYVIITKNKPPGLS